MKIVVELEVVDVKIVGFEVVGEKLVVELEVVGVKVGEEGFSFIGVRLHSKRVLV